MNVSGHSFDQFIVIGDRLLIKPIKANERSPGGLYLPPSVKEKEQIQSGYVIKTGPGYPIPVPEENEPWKDERDSIKYIPLQAQPGDLALFLNKQAFEMEFDSEKYFILPQAAVLMVIRDEGLLE